MKRKLLSVLLTTALLLTMLPLGALSVCADASGTTGDCTWSTTWSAYGTALTISGEGAMEDYSGSSDRPWGKGIISVTIENGVTHIGDGAFSNCEKLTEVVIPNSVISIGVSAFARCTNLTSVSIGESVAVIGKQAFYFCSKVTSWSIPDSVTTIDIGAFDYCYGLTKLVLPDSVVSIGEDAFGHCRNLTSISVGSGVTSIGSRAFGWCTGLEEVCITDLAAWCRIKFGDDFSNPLYYAHNLYLNENLITNLTIPNSVTGIGDYAFYSCTSLASVVVGDSVTTIGGWAFSNCDSLTSVTIGDSVTTIGKAAISNCDSLTSVTVGDSVTTIGEGAFSYCTELTALTIPSSVTAIGHGVFHGCDSLTAIEVDEHNANYCSVEGVLFAKDTMTLLRCPEGKTGNYTVPDIANSIDAGAFWFCDKLTSVVISDSVTYVGRSAFTFCTELTSLTIGNGVTTIENYAFDTCTNLDSVSVGNSVTTIGNGAFRFCDNLASVHIADLAAWCGIDFADYAANPLYYARKMYLNNVLITDLVIPDSVTNIGKHAFSNCDSLTAVSIGNSVTNIGEYAFHDCDSLNAANIGNSVTTIGEYAFSNCDSLTSVSIGNSLTNIGYWVFSDCANLISVTIPDSVTRIEFEAFYGCSGLTDVYYSGSESDKSNMAIDSSNDSLLNATWHYNYSYPKDRFSADVEHSVMDTANGTGLAFRFELTAKGVVKDVRNVADLTNATVEYFGNDCKLVGMGAIVTNNDTAAADLTLNTVNDYNVVGVPAVYLQETDEDSCAFAVRVIDIPDNQMERTIYARPYYIVEVDGEQVIVYGDVDSATCAEHL